MPKQLDNTIYGSFWDRYIDRSREKVKAKQTDLRWPGDEWGKPADWEQLYQALFVRHGGVEAWKRAVEIGQGSGKYTEKVLRNPELSVRAYDVSAKFLEICEERCQEHVRARRLSLREIEPTRPGFVLEDLADWKGQVDAVYSIDAMVHVDLQYLMAYLLTAAVVLRPGGKLILTLATANTTAGFQKLCTDVATFWHRQAGGSGKFEWLSGCMVEPLLSRLGFEIDYLAEFDSAISLSVVASLAKPKPELERYLIEQPRSP